MAIKFKTEKARELKTAYDNLYKEYEQEKERCRQVFFKYCDMEGMYGKKVHSWDDDGQGLRGYHFEYATESLRQQENTERKQFLIDNNYRNVFDLYDEYNNKLSALNEAFCLEQYGMTVAQKELEKRIAQQKKEIKSLKKKLDREEKYLIELENELKKSKNY